MPKSEQIGQISDLDINEINEKFRTIQRLFEGVFDTFGEEFLTNYLNNARHDLTTRHTLGGVVPHDSLLNLNDVNIQNDTFQDNEEQLLLINEEGDAIESKDPDEVFYPQKGRMYSSGHILNRVQKLERLIHLEKPNNLYLIDEVNNIKKILFSLPRNMNGDLIAKVKALEDSGSEANEINYDGTTGNVLRQSQLLIEDGTNANTIQCSITSRDNGDSDGPTDNIGKTGTIVGNYILSVDGKELSILAGAWTGDAVFCFGADAVADTSGVSADMNIDYSGGITLTFTDSSLNAIDLASLVDQGGGAYIKIVITYLTDE